MNLNDYEKKIKDLPGMDFERLIHELLIKEYPEIYNLTHLGKQEGRDVPTKGAVDVWFTSKKEGIEVYTFVEITTQQQSLRTKIISDLNKAAKLIKKHNLKVN